VYGGGGGGSWHLVLCTELGGVDLRDSAHCCPVLHNSGTVLHIVGVWAVWCSTAQACYRAHKVPVRPHTGSACSGTTALLAMSVGSHDAECCGVSAPCLGLVARTGFEFALHAGAAEHNHN
jgi:hypothetical protein